LDEQRFTVFEMDCIGTTGRLRITDSGMRLTWSSAGDSPHYSGYRTLGPGVESAGGFRDAALHLIEDAVTALRAGTQPWCSGEDALAALAVATAARTSLTMGVECPIGEVQ
jgi:predicted dehydrogenase